jgi:glycosyltransferase involved in cell wall biosynthesis
MWSPYVSPIGFLFGKPVIIHLKDVWLLTPKIARILMKCNPYSTYIAVSKYVYTLFTGQFGIPISNTVTIYDGIDTSLFTLPDHETITNKFRTKYKSLIMISRISPERDIEIFIDMAYLLSKKYPDMKFFHYGMKSDHVQKDYVISLKNRIRLLKLVKKLQLKQYVTSPKKIALILQKSFMSIVPARSFALPNVAIESQLCGTPVIALDIGGNSEVLTNKTGTVLTSSSSILFAQAVESFIADPRKYFNAIVTGERVSKKKFNAINQFKKIQKLYDSILNDQ